MTELDLFCLNLTDVESQVRSHFQSRVGALISVDQVDCGCPVVGLPTIEAFIHCKLRYDNFRRLYTDQLQLLAYPSMDRFLPQVATWCDGPDGEDYCESALYSVSGDGRIDSCSASSCGCQVCSGSQSLEVSCSTLNEIVNSFSCESAYSGSFFNTFDLPEFVLLPSAPGVAPTASPSKRVKSSPAPSTQERLQSSPTTSVTLSFGPPTSTPVEDNATSGPVVVTNTMPSLNNSATPKDLDNTFSDRIVSDGLSGVIIVGIVIGCLVVLLLAAILYILITRQKNASINLPLVSAVAVNDDNHHDDGPSLQDGQLPRAAVLLEGERPQKQQMPRYKDQTRREQQSR